MGDQRVVNRFTQVQTRYGQAFVLVSPLANVVLGFRSNPDRGSQKHANTGLVQIFQTPCLISGAEPLQE